MTKLKFRDNGISEVISSDLSRAKSYIESALYYAVFNIPNDFKYKDYLANTKNTINSHEKKVERIINQVPKTDDELLKIFKNIDKVVKLDSFDKIPNKERLIK